MAQLQRQSASVARAAEKERQKVARRKRDNGALAQFRAAEQATEERIDVILADIFGKKTFDEYEG